MDPKFIKLEEAAEQLGIDHDHLNALREEGKLRAYRDGASWKFRTEEIDRMAAEGVPAIDEESGINLDLDNLMLDDDKGIDDASKSDDLLDLELESSDDDSFGSLEVEDEAADDLDLDLSAGSSADLAIDLDEEKTADPSLSDATAVEESAAIPPAGGSDLDLELEIESGDDPESILLSEVELGDSDRPPSTIIGKSELDDALDLELASDESGSAKPDPAMSDVKLADLEDLDSDASATGELPAGDEISVDFDDVEDLGIDLEAESSRILQPEDVAAAQQAASAQAQQQSPETSDLELDLDDDYELASSSSGGLSGLSSIEGGDDEELSLAGSEINLGDESKASGAGLTGLSALELDDDDDDDDFVLGDGSDLTLSSADSGINLSPADSGLSLDDAALDLGGSAVGSGIDFGEASGLVADDDDEGGFELTPMAEEDAGDDDDDSSQVIALDAFEEQQEADDLLGAGAPAAAAMPAAGGFSQAAMVPRQEIQFTGWQVFFLTLCLMLLALCGMMTIDVIRSMWSWEEPYQVNSTIIDSLRSFLFP
ncbi:helix-turn-helix domain-containing protein [Aeoliella sp.]|uniref:helix-turn-helix domain-containing protein n=1 Tax=Aeoliella sp. TaxID=2795800 RepID=UPI003CCC1EE1